MFNEGKKPDLGSDDVRYTQKGGALYAFSMGWPEKEFVLPAVGTGSAVTPGKVVRVQLLGSDQKLEFAQGPDALRVKLPSKPAGDATEIGSALKVTFA